VIVNPEVLIPGRMNEDVAVALDEEASIVKKKR